MNFRRTQTEEAKAAKEAEKARKDLQKAVAADQAQLEKQRAEREKQRQAYLASPAGRARAAFERSDRLFQFVIDVANTKPVVVAMTTAYASSTSTDPTAILNAVCDEGWDLVNGSFVFHELGSESRDKFMSSGQQIAVRGTVIGYYLFRRSEQNKKEKSDPWDIPEMQRACPHCGEPMDAAANLCPQCHSQSQPWQWAHGYWWRAVGSDWHYYDPATGAWKKQETTEAAGEQATNGN